MNGIDGLIGLSGLSGIANFAPSSWALFALIFVRAFGTTAFAPVVGGADVPRSVRAAFAFALALLAFPVASTGFVAPESWRAFDGFVLRSALGSALDSTAFGGSLNGVAVGLNFAVDLGAALLLEAAFGVATGLSLALIFAGASLAGETIARVGGISVAGVLDPTTGEEVSAVSRFLTLLALAVFATSGGVETFVEGFLNALTTVAPGREVSPESVVFDLTRALTLSFALSLKLAAPVLLSTCAVYLATGFLGRILTRLNLASISFNANAILTFVALFLAIGFVCRAFRAEISGALTALFAVGGNF